MNHVPMAKVRLQALFEANLAGKLAEADAAFDDGVTTPAPREMHRTEKLTLGDYPALEFVVRSSSPQMDSHAQVYRHVIAVGVTVAGDDEQVLTTQVEKYLWAIRQVARDTVFAPPDIGTGPIDTGEEQYTLLQASERLEVPLVKGGWVEIVMTTVE